MIFDQAPVDRKVRTFTMNDPFLDAFRGKQPNWGFGALSYFTYKRTYSRALEDGTTEEFWQTCRRVVEGVYNIQKIHCRRLGLPWSEAKAQRSAQEMFQRMWEFKWTPPGRGLWMMGTDIVYEKGGAGLNNCAFVSSENIGDDFSGPFTFLMDMSMMGVGVGGDTRGAGKAKIRTPRLTETPLVVEDSREGWVAMARSVLDSFVGKGPLAHEIDFRLVRPRGEPIKGFGGVASGPNPLARLVKGLVGMLLPEGVVPTFEEVPNPAHPEEVGTLHISLRGEGKPYRITSSGIVDIFNMVGACVVAGGVRRSAEIMFGQADDQDFRSLKDPTRLKQLDAIKSELELTVNNMADGHPELVAARAKLAEVEREILDHPMVTHRWASNNSIFAEVGMDYSDIAPHIAANGEPGLLWLDNMRGFSRMADPRDDKDWRAMGMNPCITGDTIIATTDGPKRADKMIDRPFTALVDGESYECRTGVFKTGTKPVFLLQTEEGHSVRVTADHKILTAPKVTLKKRYEAWVEAEDLEPGDKVILNNTRDAKWDGMGTFDQGWLMGNLIGDGHIAKGGETAKLEYWGDTRHHMLQLAQERIESLGGDPRYHKQRTGTEVGDRDMVTVQSVQLRALLPEFGIGDDKGFTNDNLVRASSDCQAGFLRGLFDADGYVIGTQAKGVSVRLGLNNLHTLQTVQRMLMNFGINSTLYDNRRSAGMYPLPDGRDGEKHYLCEAMHELVISNDNIGVFADRIGFDEPDRAARLTAALDGYKRKPNRDRFVATVKAVLPVGIEDVFDCTVDEVHRFGANGITVHNCSEQTLESYELCCLVETYPAHHESYEDFQRTLKFAYLYAKTVTLVPTHDERTNAVMIRNKRIGCSQSGIRQAIARHGRRNFLQWCDKGYGYIHQLDRIYSDWLGVPLSIKTTSVKPSGTVSLLAGATPGVHAAHSEFYIRNVRVAGTSPLVEQARLAGFPVELDRNVSDTWVVSFPVRTPNYDKGKEDLSIWEQFALVADMQRYWADNSVSATITFRPEEADQIQTCLEVFEDRLKAISLLPYSDHGYVQAPYIAITEDEYFTMMSRVKYFTLTGDTHEVEDAFCDGDTCVIPSN
jgi:ribonucleotide reductase class II